MHANKGNEVCEVNDRIDEQIFGRASLPVVRRSITGVHNSERV